MVMKMELIVVLVVLIAGPCRANPKEKRLIDQMRMYGLKKKEEMNISIRQYLVVLVASHDEILHGPVEDFKDTDFTHNFENGLYKDRVELFLNDDQKHGEWQCIHLGILDKMLEHFRRIKPEEFPNVLMYSFYIPCADLPNLGYSCSEELATFASENSQTSGLLVAYSEIFNGTNKQKAMKCMQDAGISLYKYQQNAEGRWDLNYEDASCSRK